MTIAILRRPAIGSLLAGVCAVWSAPSLAQSAAATSTVQLNGMTQDAASSDAGPGDIIVTAQRRNERLQDVPISVVSLSPMQVANAGITSNADLGQVTPGLVSAAQYGYFQPHLRGIGTTAPSASVENPVAVYVDGVYYGVEAGSILSLAGIKNIEVDKGPQGTLFGRNATGGLIQISTLDPEHDFSGVGSATLGNYLTGGGSLYITGGITSNIASNLSVYYQDQSDGFGKNFYNGKDVSYSRDLSVRQKTLFTPGDRDKILLTLDYSQNNSAPVIIPAPGTVPLGGPAYTGPRHSADGFFQPVQNEKQGGVALKIDHDLDFATLESISAYRRSRLYTSIDGTLVTDPDFALNIALTDSHTQVTQELLLNSKPESPITWTAGFFFYDAIAKYDPVELQGGLLAPLTSFFTNSNSHAWSEAAFAQASGKIAKATTLTLGFRYTWERRRFSETQSGFFADGSGGVFGSVSGQKQSVAKPTWRISLDHKLNSNMLIYASYNRGFKSGGFDDQQLPVRTYQPEKLDAYEVGSKNTFMNGQFQANIAGFYYNYRNVQTVAYPAGTEIIYSAPKATIYGIDADFRIQPQRDFSVTVGLEWLHAKYGNFPDAQLSTPDPAGGTILSSFNAVGKQLPLAPHWTIDIGPNYVMPLGNGAKIDFAVAFSFNSGFYYEPDNRLKQGSYTVTNVSAAYTTGSGLWTLRLWAKNLTQTAYTTGQYAQTNGDYAAYAPPRTFGATLSRKF